MSNLWLNHHFYPFFLWLVDEILWISQRLTWRCPRYHWQRPAGDPQLGWRAAPDPNMGSGQDILEKWDQKWDKHAKHVSESS
jgi:hypothetical protein